MALAKKQVEEIIKKYGKDEHDTGSSAVQIALLTAQINALTEHLKVHKHDHHSRRGLFVLVGRRRGLLDYMSSNDHDAYLKLIADLNLRK